MTNQPTDQPVNVTEADIAAAYGCREYLDTTIGGMQANGEDKLDTLDMTYLAGAMARHREQAIREERIAYENLRTELARTREERDKAQYDYRCVLDRADKWETAALRATAVLQEITPKYERVREALREVWQNCGCDDGDCANCQRCEAALSRLDSGQQG